MITNQSKKIFTYILFGVLIFSIIKIIPNNKLNDLDTALISVITIVICMSMDKNMTQQTCPQNNKHPKSTEHLTMENITANTTPNTTANTTGHSTLSEQVKHLTHSEHSEHREHYNQADQLAKLLEKLKKDHKINIEQFVFPSDKKSTTMTSSTTKQVQVVPDKIVFPFSEDNLKTYLNDILKAKDNQQIAAKVRTNSKLSLYYEIFVQLVQTNVETVYRILKKDFNKLNEIILDVKLKRETDTANSIKIDGKDLSVSGSRELSNTVSSYLNKMTKQGKYIDSNGFVQNIVDNEMRFTMYSPTQNEKLGTYDASFTNEWKNDYALLNTDKWRPPISNGMYKCKTEKKCPVCPSLTTGYPVRVKDFDIARKILPPDMINTDFINEKLNTGLA